MHGPLDDHVPLQPGGLPLPSRFLLVLVVWNLHWLKPMERGSEGHTNIQSGYVGVVLGLPFFGILPSGNWVGIPEAVASTISQKKCIWGLSQEDCISCPH